MKMTYALSTNSLLSDQRDSLSDSELFSVPSIHFLMKYLQAFTQESFITCQLHVYTIKKISFVFLIYFSSWETCTFIIIFPRNVAFSLV